MRCEEEKRNALARLLGLNVEWDAAVTTLSRGERQRYGLLCACMKQAPLVLLDEPTSALDEEGVRSVCRLLEHLRAQGHTIVLSTHDPRLYPSAQYCYSFVDGRLQKEAVGREEALSSKTPPVQTKAPLISIRVLSRRMCQKGSLVFGLCRIAFLCVLCLFPLLEEALFAQAGDAWISLANTARRCGCALFGNAPLLVDKGRGTGQEKGAYEDDGVSQGRPFMVVPDPRLTQSWCRRGWHPHGVPVRRWNWCCREVHLISIVPDADVSERNVCAI
ncbi:MAG: ATP-binding cassette domain-containing protein [Merdibacter sp.]